MPDRPERLHSARRFSGKLIDLRVDAVRLPSGRETTREVVEHPGSVVILPITGDGELILVRQHRYAIDRELIELPAGLIDPGETPLETARRELREETGHVSDNWREIATVYPSAGFSNERVTIFLATGCRLDKLEDRDEGLEIERWTHEQVLQAVLSDPFPFENAATAIALLWYATRYSLRSTDAE